jgi:hypothetical protein
MREQAPTSLTAALFPCLLAEWEPWYTPQEQAWSKTEKGSFLLDGWWKFADGLIAIPESLAPRFVKQFRANDPQDHPGPALLHSQAIQH